MYQFKHTEQARINKRAYMLHPEKIGGLERSHRRQRIAEALMNIESGMMFAAFKANRAAAQREGRRAKR